MKKSPSLEAGVVGVLGSYWVSVKLWRLVGFTIEVIAGDIALIFGRSSAGLAWLKNDMHNAAFGWKDEITFLNSAFKAFKLRWQGEAELLGLNLRHIDT